MFLIGIAASNMIDVNLFNNTSKNNKAQIISIPKVKEVF